MFINRLDALEIELKGTNRLNIMAIELMHSMAALFVGKPSLYKQLIR